MPTAVGATALLELPGEPPSGTVRLTMSRARDQGAHPTCTAEVALALLRVECERGGKSAPELSTAALYLLSLQTAATETTQVKLQELAGVPLATTLQCLCLYGAVPVEHLDAATAQDPGKLRASLRGSLDELFARYGWLPGPFRALRLFPTADNLRRAVHGGKAVGLSLRIDGNCDRWMQNVTLQRATDYVLPEPNPFSPRLATHAVTLCGFEERRPSVARVRNSFGPAWGVGGDFYVREAALLNSALTGCEFLILM
jgi:hypothetical protein